MTPLRDGTRRLLTAARAEEWTIGRVLTPEDLAREGDDGAPEIKNLLVRSSTGRRYATAMLRAAAAGLTVDDCAAPAPGPAASWTEAHGDAHESLTELLSVLDAATEEELALNPGIQRNHPQYLWRHVVIYGAREPMTGYAEWFHRKGRSAEAIGILSRWYDAVRGAGLPTKARSDASYDLACGLARAERLDEAMTYLPDAFAYNDRAAVGVLKAWAREDPDLANLAPRSDFRTLTGVR
jgi:tetratricopeptide (TPR) repeat protein